MRPLKNAGICRFCLAGLLFCSFLYSGEKNKVFQPVLVIHGGAGAISREKMMPEVERQYQEKMREALIAGFRLLQSGGTSLDAVEASIRLLEDSPLFNAGKGAVFTAEGTNELDASIMDGNTLKAGAVAGLRHIKNPISLARQVMEKSAHVMMVGDGAEAFARQQGIEMVTPDYFYTEPRWLEFQRIKQLEKQQSQGILGQMPHIPEEKTPVKFGTVGAVALDREGNLAAGTSTGGMTNKKFGRVGDSPIIGAGTYASNASCAVSATGHGEYFIRSVAAHDIAALMEYRGLSIQKAARLVILGKMAKLGGTGGVIALDRAGNIATSFNTAGMYRGWIRAEDKPSVAIYK
jgi:L-asparaginase / beta-aspartyl-peptidase